MSKYKKKSIKISSILFVCLFSLLLNLTIEINYNKKLIKDIEKVNAGSDTVETITQKLDLLQAEVLDKNTWKLVGTVTSTNSLNLPTEYNELHIFITNSSGIKPTVVFNIKKQALTSSNQSFKKGYSSVEASNYGRCSLNITLTSTNIEDFYINGSNVVSSSTMKVYYR